jgi:transposase, IS30 family
MKEYSHLSAEKREQLAQLRLEGVSMTECGRRLGVDKSTISRELKRNTANVAWGVYLPDRAQNLYTGRRRFCKPKVKMNDPVFRKSIMIEVTKGRSPECIAGRLVQQKAQKRISHETLYQWIYTSAIGKRDKIYEYLPRGQKKRRKQNGRSVRTARLEGRVFIEARSTEANERIEFGHFESDSVLGTWREAVNTLVERMSRKVFITKLPDKTAAATRRAIVDRLQDESVRSITADNGPENAEHQQIATALNAQFFFCHPYHSWEKGTNENRNGVIRRYLPKGTDLSLWSQDDLDEIADDINNTPMKCLGYQTPNEVYSQLRCTRN